MEEADNHGTNNGDSRIIYDEKIVTKNGDVVIARLCADGYMLLGRDGGKLRRCVFFMDPVTRAPWVPDRETFRLSIQESLDADEYDLDGDVVCLESFMTEVRRLLSGDR